MRLCRNSAHVMLAFDHEALQEFRPRTGGSVLRFLTPQSPPTLSPLLPPPTSSPDFLCLVIFYYYFVYIQFQCSLRFTMCIPPLLPGLPSGFGLQWQGSSACISPLPPGLPSGFGLQWSVPSTAPWSTLWVWPAVHGNSACIFPLPPGLLFESELQWHCTFLRGSE